MGLFKKKCPFYEPTTSFTPGRCLNGGSSLLYEQLSEYCFGKFKACPQYSTKITVCPYSKLEGNCGYWCDKSYGSGLYGQGTRTQVSAKYYEEQCADKFKRCPSYNNKPLVCSYCKITGTQGYWCEKNNEPGLYGLANIDAFYYENICKGKYEFCIYYRR